MIWPKLMAAMQAMSNPVKDKTANAGKYHYNYSDLAQVLSIVKPALTNNGLGLIQYAEYEEGIPYLVTAVFDEEELVPLSKRRMHDYTDAQAQGSGLTYTRRYELLTVFGLAAEDDDGSATKQAEELPKSLKEAQQMLIRAERAYCWEHGYEDVNEFHKNQIMTRDDYRNDPETLTRIAMELTSVG